MFFTYADLEDQSIHIEDLEKEGSEVNLCFMSSKDCLKLMEPLNTLLAYYLKREETEE